MAVLLVLSGPSGVGKGTVASALVARHPDLWLSVSATTRPPRPGEVPGSEYRFMDRHEFEKWREVGDLVEWMEVYGNLYGTPRRPLEEHLDNDDDVLLEIDVKGALAVKAAFPSAVLVFLVPPDRDTQRARLTGRATDAPEEIERRLAEAAAEEETAARFDHQVVNRDIEQAVGEVAAILAGHRQK